MTKLMENNFLTIEHKTLSTEEFLRTKPVHCQRFVENRVNNISRILLQKQLPTHLEVALIKVNFNDGQYEKGKLYSINGNTRKEIWSNHIELRPSFVYVTIYFASNKLEVEQIYNSIDSSKSVENTGDLISGLYRSNNIIPQSKKFRSRGIGRALELAYMCFNNGEIVKSPATEIRHKKEFEFFKDELNYLDTQYVTLTKDLVKNKKFSSTNIMASLLVVGKKYGVSNPRYNELVHNLLNEIVIKKEGVSGLNDGVSVVWSNLYEKHNNNGWVDASGGGGPMMIGKILYCLDSFMNYNDIPVRSSSSTKGIVLNDEKSKEFFKTYIKK